MPHDDRDRLIGTVTDDDGVQHRIYAAYPSGLAYVDSPRDGRFFEVYEQLSGYLDEGPTCENCNHVIYDEPVIVWDGGETYCLDCAAAHGWFKRVGKVCWFTVNPWGYQVVVEEQDTGEVFEEYSAGNSPLSSSTEDSLPIDDPRTLSVATLREYGEETARELAQEHNAVYVGEVESSEEEDNE